MRVVPFLCILLLLLVSNPVSAGQKSVIFYLDGARVEHVTTAPKGYLEYPLPDSLTPGSLRVKPVGEGRVLRVEVVAAGQDRRRAKELAKLEETKSRLRDRMERLAKREEIFGAAAKSQSGKAPRKTKTNPEPVVSLQQGTDFALGRLDEVMRGQQSCQRAIDAIDRRIAAARKGAAVARIWLSGRKAAVSYFMSSQRWTPCYDFRWSGDSTGELLLYARMPRQQRGVRCLVSKGCLADGAAAKVVKGDYALLSRHALALQSGGRGEGRPLSFTFKAVEASLPPGEASAFWRGEYLGSGHYAGGGATELAIGAQ